MIYNATRRYKWPGLAAVVVSLVHIMKIGTVACEKPMVGGAS